MTAFRNCLIVSGAALGAGFGVSAFRWWLIYPLTGLGVADGSPQSALMWAIGVGIVVGALAGIAAGIGVQTNRPTGWSLLVAALVALSARTRIEQGVFSSALTHATAEFVASIIAAFVAFTLFHIVHGRNLRRAAHATAA